MPACILPSAYLLTRMSLQCRNCRNIKHEHPDAFLCNECGHCRFVRCEYSCSTAPLLDFPPLGGPLDESAALGALEEASDSAHSKAQALHMHVM